MPWQAGAPQLQRAAGQQCAAMCPCRCAASGLFCGVATSVGAGTCILSDASKVAMPDTDASSVRVTPMFGLTGGCSVKLSAAGTAARIVFPCIALALRLSGLPALLCVCSRYDAVLGCRAGGDVSFVSGHYKVSEAATNSTDDFDPSDPKLAKMWSVLTAEENTFYDSLADAGEPAPADSFLECAERCYTSSECQTYSFCPISETAGCACRRHCRRFGACCSGTHGFLSKCCPLRAARCPLPAARHLGCAEQLIELQLQPT
jgi:hypothetical protein